MTKDDIIEELHSKADLFKMAAVMVENDETDIAISHLDEADSWDGMIAREMIDAIKNMTDEEDED